MDELLTQNAEVHRLKSETRDLHKLWNEVRQLREQTQGLDLLPAENERLTAAVAELPEAQAPAIPPPAFTLEQLKFSGYGTPEATLLSVHLARTPDRMDPRPALHGRISRTYCRIPAGSSALRQETRLGTGDPPSHRNGLAKRSIFVQPLPQYYEQGQQEAGVPRNWT